MNAPAAAPPPGQSERLLALLGLLYEGPTEATPWQAFAEGLRHALGARNVMITLHHEEGAGRDTYVQAGPADDPIDWAAAEAAYRAQLMADDPLRPDRMQPGQLVRLAPVPPDGLLGRLGLSQGLRACVAEPGGLRCWIDAVHDQDPPRCFDEADLALLRALLPHLARALQLFARLNRQESERALYAGLVEHFALGCLLLNEAGELLHVNRVAAALVERWPGLVLRQGRLQLPRREAQRQFEQAVGAAVQARRQSDGPADGALVRLDDGADGRLGLLVCPAPRQPYYQGAQVPGVIVYLSDLGASLEALRPGHPAAPARIGQLFDLTPQEARLALLLAYGHTLAEAAGEMGIAETAARNYSKRIYAKLGIGGQTALVRLMLRSVMFLR